MQLHENFDCPMKSSKVFRLCEFESAFLKMFKQRTTAGKKQTNYLSVNSNGISNIDKFHFDCLIAPLVYGNAL